MKYTFEEVAILNALNNSAERLTAQQLVNITGIQKRRLHDIISRLQTNGELIVGSKKHSDLGYKIARTQQELDTYFNQAGKQISSLQIKIANMKKNCYKVKGYKQQLQLDLSQE